MSRPTGRYTDQDVEHYERPRRHTRPRTKERPTYDDAVDGVVLTVDRGRFTLLVDDTTVLAVKARPLAVTGIAAGLALFLAREPIAEAAGKLWNGARRKKGKTPAPKRNRAQARNQEPTEKSE